jgi:TPP-dependent pyruvate/acetoin dehydrogenase alpha subunit
MNKDQTMLLECYALASKIRAVEEMIANEYSNGEMRCPVHLSIGQELVSAVVGLNQQKDDTAVSSHRAHAHYLAKGGDLKKMIAEIYGKATGCCKGRGGSMHLIDLKVGFLGSSAIVGNSIPIGVGSGLSHKLNNSDALSFIFFGDGAIEEGSFYESVNFSAVHDLPTVYICENNLYSVYTRLNQRQPPGRDIYTMVEGMGIIAVKIETSNAFECLKSTTEVINLARTTKKPVFIEYDTYRWLEHCGPNQDDHLGYRPQSEISKWKEQDPLLSLKGILISDFGVSNAALEVIQQEIANEVLAAFLQAKKDEFPTLDQSMSDVYAK